MTKLTFALLAAPMLAAGIAVPAAAQEEARSVTVRYDDLNLGTQAGRDRLKTRVRYAVRQVCSTAGRMTLAIQAKQQACLAEASRSADVRVATLFGHQASLLADSGQLTVGRR